jgi:rhodanese-related sulfurtransferase
MAARELAALGYTNVKDYKAGKQDWIDAGLPTEGESQTGS